MKLLRWAYEKKTGKPEPYYFDYSLLTITGKPIRKWVAQCLAPNCVFNNIRILLYRLCGFKIGKHVFIGMKCYLEDMCYDLLTIGNNMTISYGVYRKTRSCLFNNFLPFWKIRANKWKSGSHIFIHLNWL